MMPYTRDIDREDYENALTEIEHLGIPSKGDLEYLICSLQDIFMSDGRQYRYSDLHDCCYATTHAAHEFARNHLDRREDTARETNGDVFNRMNRTFGLKEDE